MQSQQGVRPPPVVMQAPRNSVESPGLVKGPGAEVLFVNFDLEHRMTNRHVIDQPSPDAGAVHGWMDEKGSNETPGQRDEAGDVPVVCGDKDLRRRQVACANENLIGIQFGGVEKRVSQLGPAPPNGDAAVLIRKAIGSDNNPTPPYRTSVFLFWHSSVAQRFDRNQDSG